MQFLTDDNILSFYDVSIVIPVTAPADLASSLRRNCTWLEGNGIEVILVLPGGVDSAAATTIDPDQLAEFGFINWKVLQFHEDADPGAQLNCGIGNAARKYVLVLHEDLEWINDVGYRLRYIIHHYARSFAVCCTQEGSPACFIAEKESLISAGGFGTGPETWEIKLETMFSTLELQGGIRMYVDEAEARYLRRAPGLKTNAFPSTRVLARRLTGGMVDTKKSAAIKFDWENDKIPLHRQTILGLFEQKWLASGPHFPFDAAYNTICLVQTRNEAVHIPSMLHHIGQYCDGIVLLDDGSDDQTYEHALSPRLLLKVKRRFKGYFDDLENRNLLLKLAHLFKARWFFFMDADERLDARYCDIAAVCSQAGTDTVGFQCVHLWNDPAIYRKDLPEGSHGLMARLRMFRNMGYMQIRANREIYFPSVPYIRNVTWPKILIRHYGLMEESNRRKKHELYIRQDTDGRKQGYNYDYLLDKEIKQGNIEDIELKNIAEKKVDEPDSPICRMKRL
jgi:glycosyltransferase involved in cell wall biosynthesis